MNLQIKTLESRSRPNKLARGEGLLVRRLIIYFLLIFYSALSLGDVFSAERLYFENESRNLHYVPLSKEAHNEFLNLVKISSQSHPLVYYYQRYLAKKLSFKWHNNLGSGPIAEFHENGEILFDAYRLLSLSKEKGAYKKKALPHPFSSAGFFVHELSHAVAYDLHKRGLLKDYNSRTKINEILAYSQQLRYIEEIESLGFTYTERRGLPPWDKKVIWALEELSKLHIDQRCSEEEAYNKLFDKLLDSKENTAVLYYTSLEELYSFILQSAEAPLLWSLQKEKPPDILPTLALLKNIKEDLESKNQNFKKTMYFFKNRIPLYSPYPDFIFRGQDGIDYIKTFESLISKDFSENFS